MVNKERILQLLKSSNTPVSGEYLSSILGISRTAVWKNINTLKDSGYKITGGSRGYILNKEDDMLTPYEFEEDSSLITYVKTTSSTMDVARDLIDRGKALNNSIIVSESQSSSVSKLDSSFNSPEGGLYFTMINFPETPNYFLNIYPIAATVAVNKVLKDVFNKNVTMKWPFENYLEGEKISGVITETHLEKNRIKWQTLGIGINCNLTGKRREILKRIKEIVNNLTKEPDHIIDEYIKKLNIINSEKSFIIEGKTYKGIVKDIDIQGTLTLENSGSLSRCYIGNSSQED